MEPEFVIFYAPCDHRGLRGWWHRFRGHLDHTVASFSVDELPKESEERVVVRWNRRGILEIAPLPGEKGWYRWRSVEPPDDDGHQVDNSSRPTV